MGRRPGSKNKPKEPKIRFTLDTLSPPSNSDVNASLPSSGPVKPKRHRRTKAEMEAYRASLKVQEKAINRIQSALEDVTQSALDLLNNNIVESSHTDSTQKDEQVPAKDSEPKQEEENTENINVENLDSSQPGQTTQPKNKQNKNKQAFPLCDCCKSIIWCQPHRIDTNIITAQVADYHRESPRWINLCTKCAQELSSVVDNWLKEKGCISRMEQRMMEKEI